MSAPLAVLVAEDDAHIALALQAMVRKALPGCRVELAEDGDAAWQQASGNAFDLIISDWNMPGLTGEELLARVRAQRPDLPFLMLTARTDRASVLAAIQAGVSDYLCKPFERETLMDKVQRLTRARPAELAPAPPTDPVSAIAERLKQGELGFLVLPAVAFKINEILDGPDPSADDIVAALELDPSLAGRIIATANSPFYCGRKRVDSLREAVVRLGQKETGHVVMAAATRNLFNAEMPLIEALLEQQWLHSMSTAACARQLALRLQLPSPEGYFTVGLLHDIGKFLLLSVLQDLYRGRGSLEEAAVRECLAHYHQRFGVSILQRWDFPAPFIEIVSYHHDRDYLAQCAPGLAAVELADVLVSHQGLPTEGEPLALAEQLLRRLGLGSEDLPGVLEAVEHYVEQLREVV